VSTTGVGVAAFALWRESRIEFENIQISLLAPREESRRLMMASAPSLVTLLKEGQLCLESGTFRKVKFNLVLIRGINDSHDDLDALVSLFKGTGLTVKLSALNRTRVAMHHDLHPSSLQRAQQMASELRAQGVDCYVFGAFSDIDVS